jgi:hypothetical protein
MPNQSSEIIDQPWLHTQDWLIPLKRCYQIEAICRKLSFVSVNPRRVKPGALFLAFFNPSQSVLTMAIFRSIQTTNHILLKSAFSTSIKRPQDRTRLRCFSVQSLDPELLRIIDHELVKYLAKAMKDLYFNGSQV